MTKQLSEKYLSKIGVDFDKHDEPSYSKLQEITEAHLATIPFGNLGQHGCGDTRHDFDAITDKILTRNREGFCYELNGLLAQVLQELGYTVKCFDAQVAVKKGPSAFVWMPEVHVWLLVKSPVDGKEYFTDVGFGEPAIHPLEYVMDKEQKTADGLTSRLTVDPDGFVVLEWLVMTPDATSAWEPRLRWNRELELPKAFQEFAPNFAMVLSDKMPFCMKFVIVKVTRELKLSVAGNKMRRTSPRDAEPVVTEFESIMEVRKVLDQEFGITMEETEGLDWTKSLASPPELWAQW